METINSPILVIYKEGASSILAPSPTRASSSSRCSMEFLTVSIAGGYITAAKNWQGSLKIWLLLAASSCLARRMTISRVMHLIQGSSYWGRVSYRSRVIILKTVPSATLPTRPALWVRLALLANLVSSWVMPRCLKAWRLVRQKSMTTLQKGRVIELSPMLVARISLFLTLDSKSFSYSSSENTEWTSTILYSAHQASISLRLTIWISKKPGRKKRMSPCFCSGVRLDRIFMASPTRLSLSLGYSQLLSKRALPSQKCSSILNFPDSGIRQVAAGLKLEDIELRVKFCLGRPPLRPRLVPSSFSPASRVGRKKRPVCSWVEKQFAKSQLLRVADMTTIFGLAVSLSLSRLASCLRATKVKSISRLRSWISSRKMWEQGRAGWKSSSWIRMPQVMQTMLQCQLLKDYSPMWQPTTDPSLLPSSSDTLTARLVAATLRGWQTAMRALGSAR